MATIRSKNTRPERRVFAVLTEAGINFQTHVRVTGTTVDALVEERVALFVDSPFWHLRDPADLCRLNEEWQTKLLANRRRDRCDTRLLREAGYTVVRIWSDELEPHRVLWRIRAACTRAKRLSHALC